MKISPGDVIYGKLCTVHKHRPWLVLWVADSGIDDNGPCACIVALTSDPSYPGAFPLARTYGHAETTAAASWVSLQPLAHLAQTCQRIGHVAARTRRSIGRELAARLALTEEQETGQ